MSPVSGAATRDQIAGAIARKYSELAQRLPPTRRLWMRSDPRMTIFNAAALGLIYFYVVK